MDALSDIWNDFSPAVRNLLSLALIVILVLLLRNISVRLLIRRLRRMAQATRSPWDDLILNHIEQPLRYVVIATVLVAARYTLNLNEPLDHYFSLTANTLFVVALFLLIYGVLNQLSSDERRLERFLGLDVNPQILPFLRTSVRILVLAFGALVVMELWGYDANGLITGLGLGGLAVALAAQDTLANLFGFSVIVAEQPFVEGDYIETNEIKGTVVRVGLRSTTLRQDDETLATVPNRSVANNPIINYTRRRHRNLDISLRLSYPAEAARVRALLAELRAFLATRPAIDKESVLVHLNEISDQGAEISLSCDVLLVAYGPYLAEKEMVHLAALELVNRSGLRLVAPHQSVLVTAPRPDERGGVG
jgi:MscS family membrane protein